MIFNNRTTRSLSSSLRKELNYLGSEIILDWSRSTNLKSKCITALQIIIVTVLKIDGKITKWQALKTKAKQQ